MEEEEKESIFFHPYSNLSEQSFVQTYHSSNNSCSLTSMNSYVSLVSIFCSTIHQSDRPYLLYIGKRSKRMRVGLLERRTREREQEKERTRASKTGQSPLVPPSDLFRRRIDTNAATRRGDMQMLELF